MGQVWAGLPEGRLEATVAEEVMGEETEMVSQEVGYVEDCVDPLQVLQKTPANPVHNSWVDCRSQLLNIRKGSHSIANSLGFV